MICTLRLYDKTRVFINEQLLASLDKLNEDIDVLWDSEAKERAESYRAGRSTHYC